MKLKKTSFLSLFVFVIFFINGTVLSAAENEDFKSGEVLIKFKDNSEIYKVEFSKSVDVNKIVNEYKNIKEIEYIEPNYILKSAAFPNDPDYELQWYLKPINARDFLIKESLLREQEKNNIKPIIAILDTGVDLDHPDLKEKIWINQKDIKNNGFDDDKNGYIDDISGWNFVENNSNSNPSLEYAFEENAVKHGTIVSGIAAAATNNSQGITGVGRFAQIMPLRVLDSNGTGDVYSVIRAIDYSIKNKADVINMSFVGDTYSQTFYDAIKRAYSSGILIVAAAGNTDPNVNGINLDEIKHYPVCYDGENGENMVIGVASVGKNFVKSGFSNYGGCIDLVAPGEDFYSTQVYHPSIYGFEKYYGGFWSGTSLSAPLVSGTLATIKALRPNLSAEQIKDLVLKSATDINQYNLDYKGKLGSGMLDSIKSLENILGNTPDVLGYTGKNSYIVAGLGFGSHPQIKILKPDGSVFKAFYAYSPSFSGLINVAVGDVNGDGKQEIVTSPGSGGGPHIRIFNIEGQPISQFFSFQESFRGGINVATGDINGDGISEIIVGAGKGAEPIVKIFDYKGNLLSSFLAYNKNFNGGVKVAAGDMNKDKKDEIVTGPGPGGGPHIRIFNPDGSLFSQFFAFDQYVTKGINIACGDLHGDGQAEIIVALEKDSLPIVKIFNYQGVKLNNFYAYESLYNGLHLAIGDIDGNKIAEIITGIGFGGKPEIKAFDFFGKNKLNFLAYNESYKGGIRLGVINY